MYPLWIPYHWFRLSPSKLESEFILVKDDSSSQIPSGSIPLHWSFRGIFFPILNNTSILIDTSRRKRRIMSPPLWQCSSPKEIPTFKRNSFPLKMSQKSQRGHRRTSKSFIGLVLLGIRLLRIKPHYIRPEDVNIKPRRIKPEGVVYVLQNFYLLSIWSLKETGNLSF